MPTQLTEELKKAYVNAGYGDCPCCKNSGDFDSEPYQADGDWVAHRLTCNNCGCIFDDIFTLSDVQIIQDGEIS